MPKRTPKRALCAGLRLDGESCANYASVGLEYCLYHDPKRRAELIEQSTRGGQQRGLTNELRRQQAQISTLEGLEAFRDKVLIQVSQGELDGTSAGVARKEIAQRTESMRRVQQNGHLSQRETAEQEVLALLKLLDDVAHITITLNMLRASLKQVTHFGRRDFPERSWRDGSIADSLWLLLQPVVASIGEPDEVRFSPHPSRSGSQWVVWQPLSESPRPYDSGIDPFQWLADLLDIELDELLAWCSDWERTWLKRGA